MDNDRKEPIKRSVICSKRARSVYVRVRAAQDDAGVLGRIPRGVLLKDRCGWSAHASTSVWIHWRQITEGTAPELDGRRQTQELVCCLDADISLCFSSALVIQNHCY
jgi:hypothetical protein